MSQEDGVTEEVAAEAATSVAPNAVEESGGKSLDTVIDLLHEIKAAVTAPPAVETPAPEAGEEGQTDIPGDREQVRDESPASRPWTHRRIGK